MDHFAALVTFVRVVEAGSLSAAARSLPSSLTSVSRQISQLEQHFGTQLLLRTTRRLALTEDGRILHERAKSILTEFKEIEAALSRRDRQPSGRLRVSAPSLIGRLLIAPLLHEFLQLFPSLSVDLLLVDRAVDMVEEDIHLSLRVGHLSDTQLVVRKIANLQMIVCASSAYLERRGTPQSPADLQHHECLVFSGTPGATVWRFGQNHEAEFRTRITERIWANNLDALVTAAKHGAGIVRVPSWQVEADLDEGHLRRILIAHEPAPTPLYLVFQPSRLPSTKMRAFADFLIDRWRKRDPFVSGIDHREND
jgi:DNA-binding transcriptional LysR family regulator